MVLVKLPVKVILMLLMARLDAMPVADAATLVAMSLAVPHPNWE